MIHSPQKARGFLLTGKLSQEVGWKRAEVDPASCIVLCLSRTVPLMGKRARWKLISLHPFTGRESQERQALEMVRNKPFIPAKGHGAASLRLKKRPSHAIRVPLLRENPIIPATPHL